MAPTGAFWNRAFIASSSSRGCHEQQVQLAVEPAAAGCMTTCSRHVWMPQNRSDPSVGRAL